MKCLVFSDSHSCSRHIYSAIRLHKDAEIVFFLGDGLSDIDEVRYAHPNVKILAVRGNCDMRMFALDSIVQKTAEIEISGKKIVYTHGDLYGAKYGTGGLEKLAMDTQEQI